jgi:hypothetical protein
MVSELFVDLARGLERASFDYVLIEDSSYVGESYGGSNAGPSSDEQPSSAALGS